MPGNTATQSEPLMSTREMAAYIGQDVQTIYNWRTQGKGPKCYRVGRETKWRRSDVDAWLEDRAELPSRD